MRRSRFRTRSDQIRWLSPRAAPHINDDALEHLFVLPPRSRGGHFARGATTTNARRRAGWWPIPGLRCRRSRRETCQSRGVAARGWRHGRRPRARRSSSGACPSATDGPLSCSGIHGSQGPESWTWPRGAEAVPVWPAKRWRAPAEAPPIVGNRTPRWSRHRAADVPHSDRTSGSPRDPFAPLLDPGSAGKRATLFNFLPGPDRRCAEGSPAVTTRCASATLRSTSDRMSAGSLELPVQRRLHAVQAGDAQIRKANRARLGCPTLGDWVCPDSCSAN